MLSLILFVIQSYNTAAGPQEEEEEEGGDGGGAGVQHPEQGHRHDNYCSREIWA